MPPRRSPRAVFLVAFAICRIRRVLRRRLAVHRLRIAILASMAVYRIRRQTAVASATPLPATPAEPSPTALPPTAAPPPTAPSPPAVPPPASTPPPRVQPADLPPSPARPPGPHAIENAANNAARLFAEADAASACGNQRLATHKADSAHGFLARASSHLHIIRDRAWRDRIARILAPLPPPPFATPSAVLTSA